VKYRHQIPRVGQEHDAVNQEHDAVNQEHDAVKEQDVVNREQEALAIMDCTPFLMFIDVNILNNTRRVP
jgi:hypothetical protein